MFPIMFYKLIDANRPFFFFSEAVTQRCSVKKVFLEISQNSQESTCGRVSFLITDRCIIKKMIGNKCNVNAPLSSHFPTWSKSQIFKNLKNDKSFYHEIKNIFQHF